MPWCRYPWQTEERLAAEAALRAMGIVTASMGGNLAAGGDQEAQASPLTIQVPETKAPSPDNVLAQASPADASAKTSA